MKEIKTFSNETFIFDTDALTLYYELKEPFWTAGKKFGWLGTTAGIGINEKALDFADRNNASVHVLICGKLYRALPKTWKNFADKYKSFHPAGSVVIVVMQWTKPYFERVDPNQRKLPS